jgi:prolyl 4-hydroxylase
MENTIKKQKLTSEWRTWIRDNLKKGTTFQSIVAYMIENRFDPSYSMTAVQILKDELESQTSYLYEDPRIPVDANYLETTDRLVNVRLRLDKPKIVILDNVLSSEECQELICLSKDQLNRSKTVDQVLGNAKVGAARTSKGTSLNRGQSELVLRIEKRFSSLMNWPSDRAERLQIINYKPNEEYKRHFDYFTGSKIESSNELKKGGQRVSTLVVYLNDVEEGGATSFPSVGLSVLPKKGSAVYFEYCNSLGQVDPLSLHAGDPVVKGEKWVVTQWMRQWKIEE